MYMAKNPTDETSLVEIISNLAKNLSTKQQLELIDHIKLTQKEDEKRGSTRKAVKVSVDYAVEDKFYSDILENISAGGAFIRTTRLFQTGHSARMVVSLPEIERNIKVKGEIVRLTGDGFGVKFSEGNQALLMDS